MRKGETLITVIIPCFNVEEYLEKAIASVLNQTHENLEILILDDASTDNTLEKIHSFKDERIRVIAHKQNTQKIGAVNDALKQAKGEYITFQDADDWSESTRMELQLQEFLKDNSIGICFTRYRVIGDKTFVPDRIAMTDTELKNEFFNFYKTNNKHFYPTNCPTMMISRAALEKTNGYHTFFAGRVAEDIQWIYRILKFFDGTVVDKVLYNYSIRKGSFTQIQATGVKPKYAYSWNLLSKIIHMDIYEGVDLLAPQNLQKLKDIELESCEEALSEKIREYNEMVNRYENSSSFRIGRIILKPLHFILGALGKNKNLKL